MVRSSWPERKASVILLPSGAQGESVLAVAREWTTMGLLGPALWVRPEQVRRARTGPPRIGATILVLDREHRLQEVEVDMFESLARESLAQVRLVKLRSAAPSREIDEEQDEIAEHVGEYLTKAMPMAVPTANVSDQSTDLSRLTLICAPTEFQLQQRVDWAASEYGTVVIASPEDRSSPWSGDAFVRDNDRFVGFALMHLASVAGLWNGVGVGTFELIPREASNHQSVWVSRVFLNAIITEALGRRTAAQVLELASQADSLIIDPSVGSPPSGTAFIDDEMVPAYVEQMVEASMSLDQGALSFHPIAQEESPNRWRIGIGAQLKSFGAFCLDKLKVMPKWTWRWFTSRTARTLTSQLQSDDGTHIVGQDYDAILDARDAQLITRRDEIFASERAARAAMAAPVGISTLRTTPRLWARLRELVFGSLDGSSDLTDLGFAPVEEKVPVFGRVSDVFPSPQDTWTVQDGPENLPLPIDWHVLAQGDPRGPMVKWMEIGQQTAVHAAVDVAATEHAFRLLPEPVAQAAQVDETDVDEPDLDEADAEATDAVVDGETESEVEAEPAGASSLASNAAGGHEFVASSSGETISITLDLPSDASDTPDADAPDSEPAQPPAPVIPPAEASARREHRERMQREMRDQWEDARRRRDEAVAQAEAAEAEKRRREEALIDYDSWAVSRDRSFAWRLFARLAADRASAGEAVARFAREIEQLRVPAPGELVRLRKAFHRRMLTSWLVVILVAAVLILLPIAFTEMRPSLLEAGIWYPSDWFIVVAALVVALILTTSFLAAYHRGWSSFQRRVNLTHAHLAHISEASRSARRELARLSSLHRQTVDWLDLLARAIHRPWRIRAEWQAKPDYEVARDSLPFAMSIGTVVESDYAAATRLRRMTTEHLVRRGWRADAFRDLVREVGAELGQDGTAFGVGALDDDLPHSSNNTRKMLRDTMHRESVQTRVAAPRLRALMTEIQRHSLHGSKPHVVSIDDNPLDALSSMADPAGIEEGIAWDEFLLDSLVDRREPVTPLSTSWLAQRQIQEGFHEHVTSYLVLPERLDSQLSFHEGAAVVTAPFHGAGRSSIDLVWRADVVGPLPIGAIGLWDGSPHPVVVEVDPQEYDSGI